jgi:DNA-binding response OmpR family regulator
MTTAHLANVRPIQPIRVVLASRDRRFLRVTALLLEQRGFQVHRTSKADPSVIGVLDRYRPHLVLLDATSSLADAGRAATAIGALHDRVRLVIAREGDAGDLKGFRSVDKWAPIEELAAALELEFMRMPPTPLAATVL